MGERILTHSTGKEVSNGMYGKRQGRKNKFTYLHLDDR